MWLGRLGAALMVAGCVLCVVAGVIDLTGTEVRVESACWQWAGCGLFVGGALGVPHMIVPVALTLLGLGSAIVALAGAPPFAGRSLRIGLGTLALGLLAFVVATNLPVRPGTNPAENLQIVFLYGIGALAGLVGLVVAEVSLLRTPGLPRLLGLTLAAGLSVLVFAWLPVIAAPLVAAYGIRQSAALRRRARG